MVENSIQVSVNLVYILSLGILCIISLLLAIFFDQRRILKQKPQASAPLTPKPKFIATKSGRVMVSREKIPVIYNDDDKIWHREQMEKDSRRRENGSE